MNNILRKHVIETPGYQGYEVLLQSFNTASMPIISAPSKVLVTGANGFVAIWIVRYLLEGGYFVRGTVRTPSRAEHLKKVFAEFVQNDKLELVTVGNFLEAGAFDDAVKGMDAIIHTASPADFSVENPDDMIIPAVTGTVSVLESALKHAPSVKRIVVLSSMAAIMNKATDTGVVDETSWNTESVNAVNEKGRGASVWDVYCASKTLAERAAWDFVEKHKNELKWDLVATNPYYVFGPVLHEVSSPTKLNASMESFYLGALADNLVPPAESELSKENVGYVHVRDVALAHVRALEVEEAGGKRFILCNQATNWEDWRNIVKGLPAKPIDLTSPPLTTNSTKTGAYFHDHSLAENVLGIKFLDREVIVNDIVDDFKKKGWY